MSGIQPTQTICYGKIGDLALEADFYKSIHNHQHKTIIYIHGGGLIYGTRDDLPFEYLQQFLENGYNIFAIDYPLCPEVKIDMVLNSCKKALDWFINNAASALLLNSNDYFLFGRSSGGFLANYLTARYDGKKPLKLISLYSYFSLEHPKLIKPNKHYQSFPEIPLHVVERSIQSAPLTKGSIQKRYSIYVHYRQKGRWVASLIDSLSSLKQYSLSDKELASFPPTFLSASDDDQDVPPEITSHLAGIIPGAKCYQVHKLVHDFDRDTKLAESKILYNSIIDWLPL